MILHASNFTPIQYKYSFNLLFMSTNSSDNEVYKAIKIYFHIILCTYLPTIKLGGRCHRSLICT